jgi:dihydrofolate reductase
LALSSKSLDGYIAGPSGGPQLFAPGPILHHHFNDYVCGLDDLLYGRRMYEVMRYWDEDQPEWDEIEHDFAQVWRSKPKWVASRSLTSVGPNATLVQGDLIDFAANLKSKRDGDIDVAGSGAWERAVRCGSAYVNRFQKLLDHASAFSDATPG